MIKLGYQEYAEVVALRLGFQVGPVRAFLESLNPDPTQAYLEVVEKDDGNPIGAAWHFVWHGITHFERAESCPLNQPQGADRNCAHTGSIERIEP